MDSSSLALNAWALFFIKLGKDLGLIFHERFYFMPIYFGTAANVFSLVSFLTVCASG